MINRNKYSLLFLLLLLVVSGLIVMINMRATYSVTTDLTASYTVDVTDFGANGSDSDIDTTAFQSALNKAKEELINKTNKVVKITVPSGTYYVNKNLYIYSNTILSLNKNAKIIRQDGTGAYFLFATFVDSAGNNCTGDNLTTNSDCNIGGYKQWKNITIEGGTWDYGNLAKSHCFRHGTNLIIRNATFINTLSLHGLNLSGTKDILLKKLILKNQNPQDGLLRPIYASEMIHIDAADDAGEASAYPIDGTPVKNLILEDSTFDNVLSGIGAHVYFTDDNKLGDNIIIRNNTFKNIKYDCINIFSHKNVEVYGNTASGVNGSYCFVHTLNTGVNIHDNTVSGFDNTIVIGADDRDYKSKYTVTYDDSLSSGIIHSYFIVKYKANGGSGSMADTNITMGTLTKTRTNSFTKDGYEFAGWLVYRPTYNQYLSFDPVANTHRYMTLEEREAVGATDYLYYDGISLRYTARHHRMVVEFIAQWKKIKSISVSKNPDKMDYLEGYDNIDLTGGKLLVTYEDNTTKEVDMKKTKAVGFNNTVVGQQNVTINYNGVTTTIRVNIKSNKDNFNVKNMKLDNDNMIMKDVTNNLTYTNFKQNIETGATIKFVSKLGEIVGDNSKVKTGDKAILMLSSGTVAYDIAVLGDLTGEGEITVNDVTRLYYHIKNVEKINDKVILSAANIINDDIYNVNDVTKLYYYIKGIETSLR